MKTDTPASALQTRAAEALKVLLGQVSGVKVKEMTHRWLVPGRTPGILVCVDVFGHSYTLACEVKPNGDPRLLRTALRNLHHNAAQRASDATPVLIAPFLSPEAQALCKENHAGFLDLEGNARLSVGELFIGMRSLPCRADNHPSVDSAKPLARSPARSTVHGGLHESSRGHAAVAVPA